MAGRPAPPAERRRVSGGWDMAGITGVSINHVGTDQHARQRPKSALVGRKIVGHGSNIVPYKTETNGCGTEDGGSFRKTSSVPIIYPQERHSISGADPSKQINGSCELLGIKIRPLSAFTTSSGMKGAASATEKFEIEELKKEILEITRRLNTMKDMSTTEAMLKRFVCTSDPTQVHMAKSSLMALVLQRHEEFQRFALFASGGLGRGCRTRLKVLDNLVEKAKELHHEALEKGKEHVSAVEALQTAQLEIRKLTEERELLRATLSHASKSKGGSMQIIRPFSASRVKEKPVESQLEKSCSGCETLEEQLKESRGKLVGARREVEGLEEKVAGLQREKEELLALKLSLEQRNAMARKSGEEIPAGVKDLEELRKKVAALEKTLKGKEEEVRAAKKKAEEEAGKSAKLAKEVKDKGERIKELEKLLGESNSKVNVLEKRINDLSLNMQANDESNDSAFQRERQLLKQIELLTQEMTEARKEAERSQERVKVVQREKEEALEALGGLKRRIKEEADESDAIQKKLIAEMKQLKEQLGSSQREVASRDKTIGQLEVSVRNGKDKISELEEEIQALKGLMGKKDEAEELRGKVGQLLSSNGELKDKVTVLGSEKSALEGELSVLRKKWDGREREWRQEVERTEAEQKKERAALAERVRLLEGRSSEWEKGKAELLQLRERLKEVEKEGKDSSSNLFLSCLVLLLTSQQAKSWT
ncbi:hypothetical protein GUITHDRAFT_108395 [Guillardia theta CCMP2712]|uniref:Uncharacterized protein n=1 Tax=Guillardia theta (strain CCMP2712) TaxID=905079 RepID=L1JAG5_GUITC|nr:hypothetical protein GUITHDRAFT_108395 [Guillardia theta CCMP2712]EKX45521.1 hypothetical protein GUITHDRAFT_108395 [Guillardia theta CCMP2712]|eukprot:XP_005832501.1 hypothetical protein GUITHDRAFT_108395 [Guillardia theta CCMP2712]